MSDATTKTLTPEVTSRVTAGARPVAVIDIGASAIRLRIAEIGPTGEVRNLDSLQQALRLGKDTFSTGRIQASTIEDCIKVLLGFRRVMAEYGITRDDQIRAVATSAVREAENRYAFVDRVYMSTQINVEVIEGTEENRLTYIAVQDVLKQDDLLKNADAIIVDVGGGSTELVLVQKGSVTFANSYRLGSLRMRESLETFRAGGTRAHDSGPAHSPRGRPALPQRARGQGEVHGRDLGRRPICRLDALCGVGGVTAQFGQHEDLRLAHGTTCPHSRGRSRAKVPDSVSGGRDGRARAPGVFTPGRDIPRETNPRSQNELA